MNERNERAVLDYWQDKARHIVSMSKGHATRDEAGRMAVMLLRILLRQSITPPAAVQEPVTVKALEWIKVALDSNNWNWLAIRRAETPFGRYSIDKHTEGFLRVMFGAQRVGHFDADHLSEAESAAQADYDQRIRSALSSSQSDPAPEIAVNETEQGLWRFWNEKARQQVIEIAALKEINETVEARLLQVGYEAGNPATALHELIHDFQQLQAALEPFALMSTEGVVTIPEGYVAPTTRAEYFHRARAALEETKA